MPPDVARIEPLAGPLDATVVPPGSKSITNRALVAAALAAGRSTITGALAADDTEAMIDCLRRLGLGVEVNGGGTTLAVDGAGGHIPAERAWLDVRQSGTTARFVAPVAALGHGRYEIDGAPRMRERPMADLVAALRTLGAGVTGDRMPFTIEAAGLAGGTVAVAADASSQFASGLLLAGPAMRDGLRLDLATAPVSRPYLDLTVAVMRSFGADVEVVSDRRFVVAPRRYRATDHAVEPDASAASYFFAAAAICGGRVTVPGLGRASRQGDLRFVELLARMGATVEMTDDATTVTGSAPLHGIEVDMADLSDTAPTLAVVASFASSPTRCHRHRLHPGQGERPCRRRGAGAAPPGRGRRRGARRLRRASRLVPAGAGAHLRRPPDGDELCPGRPPRAGGGDRGSGMRGQDVPVVLRGALRTTGSVTRS